MFFTEILITTNIDCKGRHCQLISGWADKTFNTTVHLQHPASPTPGSLVFRPPHTVWDTTQPFIKTKKTKQDNQGKFHELRSAYENTFISNLEH